MRDAAIAVAVTTSDSAILASQSIQEPLNVIKRSKAFHLAFSPLKHLVKKLGADPSNQERNRSKSSNTISDCSQFACNVAYAIPE